ncbi:MAG: PEP-CTERM sorting domain-containing protein [Terriglobia bacterium]
MKRVVLLLALAFLLAPVAALADGVMLDFTVAPSTAGSITYDGNGGPLVGQNISIVSVEGINTPLNNGVVVPIEGGLLNFTTGNLTGTTSDAWSFGGGEGSFIAITGWSDLSCGYECVGDSVSNAPPWLLFGRFGDATVTTFGPTFKIAGASFWDYKCWELLEYYGLGDYVWQPLAGNFNISFTAANHPPAGFASTHVLSGDVVNTVPEPGTLALLGTGLLSIAGLIRRKLTS